MIYALSVVAVLAVCAALYAAGGLFCILCDITGWAMLTIWRKVWYRPVAKKK